MSILHYDAPDSANEVLKHALPELLQAASVRTHLFKDKVGDKLEFDKTLPVFDIDPDSLNDGRLLDDLTLSNWRHLLFDDTGQAVGYIDLDAEASHVVNLTQGRFTELTLQGLEAAQNLEEKSETDYKVGYIEIRRLYFAALWLHSETRHDLIIPLEDDAQFDITAMHPYREERILAMLQEKKPSSPLG